MKKFIPIEMKKMNFIKGIHYFAMGIVCLISALPDRGCELWFAGVQKSIVKDQVNIFFHHKDYQLRYFFHNWSLPTSKSIERKITTSRKLHFSTNVFRMSAFHYVDKPFLFHSKQGGARLPSSVSGGAAVKTIGEALPYMLLKTPL